MQIADIREIDAQCRSLIETWSLVEPDVLHQRVADQAVNWPDADPESMLRLVLLAAWELHPLAPRLDRQLKELEPDSQLKKDLAGAAKILPHRLVEDHWNLVRRAAARFHIVTQKENEAEFQELLSVGREALFIAAQKYYRRPRGNFKNFAWGLLRERMRDEQNRRHPVPGKIRKKLAALSRLREEYRLAEKRLESEEIKQKLKLSPEQFRELLQTEAVWGNGLEFETDVVLEELEEADHSLDQLSQLLQIEDARRLEQALDFMEEPGRSIINKLYFEEKSLREVAEEMELSLPSFKKVHKRALADMKRYLA